MVELTGLSKTIAASCVAVAIHFIGWLLAAPIRSDAGKIHWKFLVGMFGFSIGILVLLITAILNL